MRHCREMLGVVGVGLLILSACGDDSGGSNETSGSGGTVSNAETEEILGPLDTATGDPVRVGFVNAEGGAALDLPETRESAEAAVAYANEHLGGLAGRPIELVICEDRSDGASATGCANRMVEEEVAAVLVGQVTDPDLYMPILESAGVPWIVPTGTGTQELTSDIAFAIGGGLPAILAGTAQYGAEAGYESMAVFGIDVPAFTGLFEALGRPAFEAAGIEVDLVELPPGTPDATPQVASALAEDPDAVVIFAEESLCQALLPALDLSNTGDAPILMPGRCAAEDVVESVGPEVVEGTILNGNTVSLGDDPEGQLYQAVMTTYGNDSLLAGEGANGYVAVLGLVRAMNAAAPEGDITADVVLETMRSAADVPLPGMPGDATFTCDGTALPMLPATCSTAVLFARYEDGQFVDFESVDGSALLEG